MLYNTRKRVLIEDLHNYCKTTRFESDYERDSYPFTHRVLEHYEETYNVAESFEDVVSDLGLEEALKVLNKGYAIYQLGKLHKAKITAKP